VRRTAIKETDVAAATVAWLADMGWEVYQEVSLGNGGRTVDLVARSGAILWAIECKVSLGLAVLEQAHDLLPYAHLVSVAVRDRHGEGWCFARDAMAAQGIGLFTVAQRFAAGEGGGYVWEASREFPPRIRRTVGRIVRWGARNTYRKLLPKDQRKTSEYPYLRDLLVDEQRTYAAAGNAHSSHWSPWRRTCDQVRNHVERNPGCSPGDCLAAVQHHYNADSTARTNMILWVRKGKVPGVVERHDGRLLQWWPRA